MSKEAAAWLRSELPELERAGVVDPATAARLRAYYEAAPPARGVALGLSGLLGAALVGLGLILLVAHDWDSWSRGLRLSVVALPLAAGQLACVAVLRGGRSVAWREGAALFAALAGAAALALVAQIFQFGGDLDRYLLSCALVALPLIYALDASTLAVLVAATLLGWVGAQDAAARSPLAVLLAYATLLPHLAAVWRADRRSLRGALLLAWLLPLGLAALTLAMPWLRHYGWLWLMSVALLLLFADAAIADGAPFSRRPLRAYGELGWAVVALAATFPDFWRAPALARYADGALVEAGPILLLAFGAGVLLALRAAWRRRWLLAALALPLPLIAFAQQAQAALPATLLALLFNLYVPAIGLALIAEGVRGRRLRAVSSGLALVTVLVLLRFFGSEWSFVVRGLAFVVVGLAFLAAHAWLRRKVRA